MPCEIGLCTICGGPTATLCGDCGGKKVDSRYTEVEVKWSNGAKMKVGVCVDCAVKNVHATASGKAKITHAHWDIWEKQNLTFDRVIIVA